MLSLFRKFFEDTIGHTLIEIIMRSWLTITVLFALMWTFGTADESDSKPENPSPGKLHFKTL